MSENTGTPVNFLKKMWDKAADALEDNRKQRKLNQLQLEAETSVADAVAAISSAEDELEKVILAQKDSDKPSFKKIVEANEKLKIAEKRKDIAIDTFTQFFGEKPKYA